MRVTVSMWFQTVIQWHVIGSGLVVYADWGKMPLNSWEMAVVSATVSTGTVIYSTVRVRLFHDTGIPTRRDFYKVSSLDETFESRLETQL